MRVIIDDKIPYVKGVLEPFMDVDYMPGNKIVNDDLKNVDALIIRTRTICNEELLSGTKVKFIATATIGFDHIDTKYCAENNIKWTNSPGCNSGSVKQYIAASLSFLALTRKFEFEDRTLGIIGVGNVGRKVTTVAEAIGMRVVQNDPPRERKEGVCGFISIEGLIRESDIITFHTPLNFEGEDKTYHLGNKDFFESLNSQSIIINSSRGEVVNNYDLKYALQNKLINGAVLDVWENEPDLDIELMHLVDIATPHIAGYSKDGKANGTTMSVQNLSKFFELGILDKWEAENIPLPKNTHIEVNCKGKSDTQIISEIILSTYDIANDDFLIRNKPSEFEKQRGDYPLRREIQIFDVTIGNGNEKLKQKLRELGFKNVIVK